MAVGIERFDNIWRNCTSARALQGAATETVALAKTPQGLRTAGRPSVSRTSHLAESPLRCTFPKTQLSDGGYPVKDLLCPSRVAAFFALSITTRPSFKSGRPVPLSKVLLRQYGGAQRDFDIMPRQAVHQSHASRRITIWSFCRSANPSGPQLV